MAVSSSRPHPLALPGRLPAGPPRPPPSSHWRPVWPLALAITVLGGGCRNSTCQELAEAYHGVALKAGPCLEQPPLPALDVDRCERNQQACGARDLEQLEDQAACYRRLATCQPEDKDAFLQGLTRCDDRFPSNACEAAIF
ncbi:MAG: hypothetical protein ABW123_04010 [Cystobacter sp.]